MPVAHGSGRYSRAGGSEGNDVKSTRVLIGEHVGPWVPGERELTVGGGATQEPTGSGLGQRVTDDG